MDKRDKIRGMKTIGYWKDLGGVEVKEIQHGIDDYIVCVSFVMKGLQSHTHRVKVQSTNKGRAYIVLHGYRLYLDECLRVNITGRSDDGYGDIR